MLQPSGLAVAAALAAAALAAGLGGCVAGPDYHPPASVAEELPARYANAGPAPGQAGTDTALPVGPAASGSVPERWWMAFRDPVLDQLVDAALAGNPDLAAADARVQAARAELRVVQGTGQPQLEAAGRAGHDQFSRNGENFANLPFAHPVTGFDDYRTGLDASWELDVAGGQTRDVEAQAAEAGSVLHQRDDAALRLAAETARTVLDYRYAQLRTDRLATQLADRQEILRLVRLQQRAGLASDIEVSQAEAATLAARAALPLLRAESQASVAALVALTTLPYTGLQARLEQPAPAPTVPLDVAVGAPSDLLRRRPDIRGAERALAAATARIGVAMAQRWPRFSLVGTAGWDSIHLGSLTAQASQYWSFGPQLSLPLFTGGRIQSAVEASQAQRDAAEALYRKAVLGALADVETALVRCREDHTLREQLDAQRDAFQRELDHARERVDHGDVPRTDWLAVHLQSLVLEDQRLAAEQRLAEEVVTLYKALGGGTGPSP